ncbi:TPR-like protein [Rhizophagus irregularis]|uniref:TPR-like protein n=1 Tax=Rhizophagus irregularis TaxID=588596 RepID=A0A2N1MX98_9GLOM|nr:TPR-like protein [Rhizophagus irregularis]
MEGSSCQSGSSSSNTIPEIHDSVFSYKMVSHENFINNSILLKLEEDGFITPDEKAEELIKRLTSIKYLYVLKLLFENLQNEFSPQILRDTLVALADPTPFDFYAKQSVTRLELHLRTWVTVLERICFSPIVLSKELRDKVYNSLSKFAEIHRKTTQVFEIGVDNSFRSNFNQFNQQDNNQDDQIITKKCNYNIDFLLIHLRDTLHSLRDDETWFQEIIRRIKELLKAALNITPGILSASVALPNDNCSILSMLTQIRKGLSFKYPVASYYVDWRIMLMFQHNLFTWSEGTEMIISKKFCELVLMEYLWSFLEREWINVTNKSILDSQTKFDEISNKVTKALKNTGNFLNDLAGNEPIALPHTLWFGILDLAQNLIQKSTRTATYGLCYYLAIESLNKAPSSFIQFKAVEILLHLHNIDISSEPEDQLCILKCQHTLSLNNLKLLKQKICPKCREKIEENDIRYLPQNSIYKNLYTKLSESGHIIPPIKLENSDQIYDSDDSNNSEADLILAKKEKGMSNMLSNLSLQSIILRISKEQQPMYQNIIKELYKKNYEKAEYYCREFLISFPVDYTMICILAYTYKCLNNYKQAHLCLKEAIDLKQKRPIAYFIQGEVYFRQYEYKYAINSLNISINYKTKTNKVFILLGDIYLLEAKLCNNSNVKNNYYLAALYNYLIALKGNPNSYLCLKKCAYVYNKQKKYLNSLEMLDRLLNMNKKDSLILCYYGEILKKLGRYNEAVLYFTDANLVDPENTHNLNRRAISYYALQEYNKALLDLDKATKLNSSNSLTHYYKGLTYYAMENFYDAIVAFEKCMEIDPNDNLAKILFCFMKYLLSKKCYNIVAEISQISNISDNKSLLFIRCEIYIELGEYDKALLDFNRLFELYNEDISFICLLQNYLNYWSYLCDYYKISDIDYKDIGIIDNFKKYMYKVKKVYSISNISNIHLKNDINSLSGKSFDAKDVHLNLELPKLLLPYVKSQYLYIVCKICVKNILSKNATMDFIFDMGVEPSLYYSLHQRREHRLEYDDLSKLVGLGWIEFTVPIKIKSNKFDWVQPSITANGPFIDMQIDYVRFMQFERDPIFFPKMGHLLPIYKFHPNILSSKYFPKKETENLITLEDIISYL